MLASAAAHVKWFTDPAPYPTRYDLLLSLPVLAALAVALGAVAAAWWIQRAFPEPHVVRALERYAHLAPLALGLHVGTALVVAAIIGLLFAPSLQLPRDNTVGFALLTAEAMCGLMLIAGLATRVAAALLAALGIAAIVLAGFTVESVLEQVNLLGVALFFFLVGRGAVSLDRLRGVKPPFRHDDVPEWALTLLRATMGFGVAYNALTEKLLNPPLAQSLLGERPFLNVLRAAGVADGQFVWLAGVTELAIGCVVLSPWVTRPAMVVGALIFTATLPIFGWSELLGHLPFYGTFFLLLLAPKADSWHVRRAMRAAS